MDDTARMNVIVGADIPQKLTELAGGERKRGEYITHLIRGIHAGEQAATAGSDFEQLRLSFAGLVGRHRELEGRMQQLERQVATLIAKQG
jgi:hypothetical protein